MHALSGIPASVRAGPAQERVMGRDRPDPDHLFTNIWRGWVESPEYAVYRAPPEWCILIPALRTPPAEDLCALHTSARNISSAEICAREHISTECYICTHGA
jgi:hypothetical protein